MKRQTLVEYKDASPEIQAIYDEVMEVIGSPDVFNFLKAFGNNEKVLIVLPYMDGQSLE